MAFRIFTDLCNHHHNLILESSETGKRVGLYVTTNKFYLKDFRKHEGDWSR